MDMQALEHTLRKPSEEELTRQHAAATRIQRAYRKSLRTKYLAPDFLWTDLATHARMKVARDAAEQGRNSSRDRWRRSVFLLGRLQDGNDSLSQERSDRGEATLKHLETQHWLELIDGKHRYGSNLKYYHERWRQDEDTAENFFKWLDYGGGKDLSLKECPREQLERERITYLSSEQRLNYLATIDNTGKLRWARNGELVDTTAGHWKDAGEGRGIIPFDDSTPGTSSMPRGSFVAQTTSSIPASNSGPASNSSVSLDTEDENAMMHYVGIERKSKNPVKRALLKNFTPRGLLEKLLRKTLKRNTWIYVSDKNFNIYIGIKVPGTFQHSSFLAGGLVTSAGLISVKDGLIHTLSPLSGHYRTSIVHFRRFLDALEGRRVDMSKVKISKAELALWGIEHLNKFKKKQAALLKDAKEDADAIGKRVRGVMPHRDHGYWKREILEGRKRSQMSRPEEDENTNKEISEDNQIPHAATKQSSKGEHGMHDAG